MNHLKSMLIFVIMLLTSPLAAQETLIFAIDMVRHGDRTPLATLPAVPNYPWEEGLGQLTTRGMAQHFNLGKKLRQYYIHETKLLPEKFNNKTIFVRSTDYDRTLMSAQALLTGLYPIGLGPLANGYQPIPIHTQPIENDPFLKNNTHAAEFEQLLKQYVYSSPTWQLKTAQTKSQWPKLRKATGWKIEHLKDVIKLGNTLYIYQLYHVPLPSELTTNEINDIIALAKWGMVAKYQPPEIGAFLGDRLLKEIHHYLNHASNNSELKYVLLSAHDCSILILGSALGVAFDQVPSYASHLSLRVYENQQKQKSIALYLNDEAIPLPYCAGKHCELEFFKQRLIS